MCYDIYMSEEKSHGVLLQSIPYLGRKCILKIFTPENGLISLMANPSKGTALTTPFCIAEWVYKKGNREIHTFTDGSLIDGLLPLKQNYATLVSAGAMAKDLLQSQLPAKGAKDLYELLCVYFKKLPTFSHPEILAASFRLKLLLHEGLLSLEAGCSLCGAPALYLSQGESYCPAHAPLSGQVFTPSEWTQLQQLAFARQFSALQEIDKAPLEKIERLFQERLS
jgi:DNA repair protein RecO